jgi:hypothetical protein
MQSETLQDASTHGVRIKSAPRGEAVELPPPGPDRDASFSSS